MITVSKRIMREILNIENRIYQNGGNIFDIIFIKFEQLILMQKEYALKLRV